MDPWEEMDAWCQRQKDAIKEDMAAQILDGTCKWDDEYYRQVGQSIALGRMRSYIHGARKNRFPTPLHRAMVGNGHNA